MILPNDSYFPKIDTSSVSLLTSIGHVNFFSLSIPSFQYMFFRNTGWRAPSQGTLISIASRSPQLFIHLLFFTVSGRGLIPTSLQKTTFLKSRILLYRVLMDFQIKWLLSLKVSVTFSSPIFLF